MGGSIYTSHTLNHHLEELSPDTQKAHKTAPKLHAHSVLYAHRLTATLDALLRNLVALKVFVWSRGRFVTLQILTNSSFSLMKETHGSAGQCVSLIDVGSGFHCLRGFPCFFLQISNLRNLKSTTTGISGGVVFSCSLLLSQFLHQQAVNLSLNKILIHVKRVVLTENRKEEKVRKKQKSSSRQLRKRGHLGRKVPSPKKKKGGSEDQKGCGQTSQQTSPD